MNLTELLGSSFDCECGRRHQVPVKHVLYAEDALERLSEVLDLFVQQRHCVIIADERTWILAGEQAAAQLHRSDWIINHVIVPDTALGNPICDDITFNRLKEMTPPADIALAVGSGVVNDLTKWLAFERNIPYTVIATAASMNGYAAANIATTIKGVKLLVSGRAPVAVLAIPSIIADAPYEMTAAGLGDALAKSISTADWTMNHIFHGEYFCRFCSEIINTLEPSYLNHPENIKNRQPQALDALYQALIYSGIAMTLIGTSAPASGGEHLLSHTLDMLNNVDGIGHDLHGRQVGLGTIFCSALYERIKKITNPKGNRLPAEIDPDFWGRLSDNISEQYQQKKPLLESMIAKITDRQTWGNFLSATTKHVHAPATIKNCLAAAGAAHTYNHIKCSRQRLREAILHTHQMRKRTTVIDLAWILGILPDAADDIIDSWLTK